MVEAVLCRHATEQGRSIDDHAAGETGLSSTSYSGIQRYTAVLQHQLQWPAEQPWVRRCTVYTAVYGCIAVYTVLQQAIRPIQLYRPIQE